MNVRNAVSHAIGGDHLGGVGSICEAWWRCVLVFRPAHHEMPSKQIMRPVLLNLLVHHGNPNALRPRPRGGGCYTWLMGRWGLDDLGYRVWRGLRRDLGVLLM